ncbi:MAG: 50S ribosomal protein L21 [Minisyncoccia bacterium]|jgi:large subunit ribosomal protein L21
MAKDFAIIETGGKQYKVSSGERLKVEKLAAPDGAVVFDKVLLRSVADRVEIGAPYLAGATVGAKLVSEGRGKKVIVFKYHSKTRQRKKKGHRQEYSEVEIANI